MESYSSFAEVYDMYMDNVPYDTWCENAISILDRYKVPRELVCELGCGTGNMTSRLSAAGFDMIGIDRSTDMLDIAMAKEYEECLAESGPSILYLNQDMREFELFGTVRAVVSFCDSMNYITSKEDLLQVFRLVNNYLDPGGIFLFDMNTRYKYTDILSNNTFAENREEGSFIWENTFDEETGENLYDLTLYIGFSDEDGEVYYERYEEEHVQKAYDSEEVISLLNESGLHFLEMIDADTMGPVNDTSERVYFVSCECSK